MNRLRIPLLPRHPPRAAGAAPRTLNVELTSGWIYGALIVVLAAWVLHSFLEAILAACITAIASWPLYKRFAARVSPRIGGTAASLIFTCAMAVFVLAPLLFAFWALLGEANALIAYIAAADRRGIAVPSWLDGVPLAGPWIASWWQSAHGHALAAWAQHVDPAALVGWAQSLGQFMLRHAFIVGFAILVLFFLYDEGESIAESCQRLLRRCIGGRAERYVDVATRAVHASVNSVLLVALFDGFATGIVYALAGAPHAPMWAAITGAFALVPFLGYIAVAALTLKMGLTGAATPAMVAFALSCAVLFVGDKVLRPMLAREGTRLPFVWILMGCLGGFEVLGLVGLVLGPVLLTLFRELWNERLTDLAVSETPATDRSA